MRLGTRLDRIEKISEKDDVLLAFIGIPEGTEEVFKEAGSFWEKEKNNYSNKGVRGGVPWPPYNGDEIQFLGLGTYDDLYFGLCGGIRDCVNPKFVFLAEVSDLIQKHWKEVQTFMNTHKENRSELIVSEEAVDIMCSMCR